ncbi:MAG: ribosome biogenesis GTP-binding protein YihA/YsxC [Chitinophagales bacterium]|nr:ribosome biogenesis GTP-binding protein YihA/YsxC [Chitinophagales bacterium]
MNPIKDAQFVGSFSKTEGCPDSIIPEYAFIGRSNVGKSSLVNLITGRKGLAKVSGTPGKTQLLNFFKINNTWHLVDLPGYGYARVSKSTRAEFGKLIRHYLKNRNQLTNLFVLIDSSIAPQKIDMEFMQWLGQESIPFSIIYTKTDKENQNIISKNIQAIKKRILQDWEALPLQFATSSTKGRGGLEILDYIDQLNNNISEEL